MAVLHGTSARVQATAHVTLPHWQTTQTGDDWGVMCSLQGRQGVYVRLTCSTFSSHIHTSGRRTLEERWRAHCLRAIKMRDLSAVEEMRVAYVAPGLADQGGRPVLVVVGGHYRRGGVVDTEDLMLHVVKVGRDFRQNVQCFYRQCLNGCAVL